MTNRFQASLMSNTQLIRQIALAYHPTLTEPQLAKLKVNTKYDWVCITGPRISLGIETKHGFWGQGITLANFQNIIDNNQLYIRAWRFVDDSLYRDAASVLKNGDNCPDVHNLVLDAGVPLPTAKEMYDYYYED